MYKWKIFNKKYDINVIHTLRRWNSNSIGREGIYKYSSVAVCFENGNVR